MENFQESKFSTEKQTSNRVELKLNPNTSVVIESAQDKDNRLNVSLHSATGGTNALDLQAYLNSQSGFIDSKQIKIQFREADPSMGFSGNVRTGEVGIPMEAFQNPKNFWRLLHEIGHVSAYQRDSVLHPDKAKKIPGAQFVWTPDAQKFNKDIEEEAWVRATEIAEKISIDLGVNAFELFNNADEFADWVINFHTKKYKDQAIRAGSKVEYTTLKEARFRSNLKRSFEINKEMKRQQEIDLVFKSHQSSLLEYVNSPNFKPNSFKIPDSALQSLIPRRVLELAHNPKNVKVVALGGHSDNELRFKIIEEGRSMDVPDFPSYDFSNLSDIAEIDIRPGTQPYIFLAAIIKNGASESSPEVAKILNYADNPEQRGEKMNKNFYINFELFLRNLKFKYIVGENNEENTKFFLKSLKRKKLIYHPKLWWIYPRDGTPPKTNVTFKKLS